MVSNGKADVSLLNKYLQMYNDILFGTSEKTISSKKSDKDQLYNQMKGFKAVFKKPVAFKPVVGKKITSEFQNATLQELMHMRTK